MDAQEIKNRIKWYHEEVVHKRNIAAMDEFLAPNYNGMDMLTGEKNGFEGMKQSTAQLLAMNSENHFTIEDILVEGNRAVFRWVMTSKDAQGKVSKYAGISMYTFVGGKVAEDYFIGGEVKT